MTELFKLTVETTSKLPDELQDEIAQAMLHLRGRNCHSSNLAQRTKRAWQSR